MRLTVGVMGSSGGESTPEARALVYALGVAIAEQDAVLITGGCPGLPYEAVRGAKSTGGLVVGISALPVRGRRAPMERRLRSQIGASILAALAVSLAPVAALAQDRPYDGGWGMHPMWWAWGAGGVVMMLMMLVLWGLIIAGIVLAIRWLVRQGNGSRPDPAVEILRQRYARGEIDRQEFEARKRDLS